jgi:hypothetical protein
MVLGDPALKRWLGEAVEVLDVLPILLGATLAGLGWWEGLRKGGDAPLREN